jgi:DNA-binding winged helix-turn-helix (wHTH) protein
MVEARSRFSKAYMAIIPAVSVYGRRTSGRRLSPGNRRREFQLSNYLEHFRRWSGKPPPDVPPAGRSIPGFDIQTFHDIVGRTAAGPSERIAQTLAPGSFRFDRFRLDPRDRQLWRDGAPVPLNSRYLDALALLLAEQGRLVSKDRFMGEVWRGVPVTDEALTQCIRTLRRQLGDDAASPRFIETVPKHGYRFIAPVDRSGTEPDPAPAARGRPTADWSRVAIVAAAGTAGGGAAGVIGGLLYGFVEASQSAPTGLGAISVLLVLLCITLVVGVLGGAGVSFGVAASELIGRDARWRVLGGAVGGLVVGAAVNLLGVDAFALLFGHAPGGITGGLEGAALGGAVGLGAWLSGRSRSVGQGVAVAGLSGAAAGVLISLAGGRLLAGSLDVVARAFPGSRLQFERIGGLFGESGFGPISRTLTSALEGFLFVGFVVLAMALARRSVSDKARVDPG